MSDKNYINIRFDGYVEPEKPNKSIEVEDLPKGTVFQYQGGEYGLRIVEFTTADGEKYDSVVLSYSQASVGLFLEIAQGYRNAPITEVVGKLVGIIVEPAD